MMNNYTVYAETQQASTGKKLKYKYLSESLNHSLNKTYKSPQNQNFQRSFTDGRRNTIGDFSPNINIEQQHGRIKKNILQEITVQNNLLTNQILEYKAIVGRLEQQAFQKDQKIMYFQEQLSKDHQMYQRIILEMKEAIQQVMEKNVVLEGESARITDLRAKERILSESLKGEQDNLLDQISSLIVSFERKESMKSSQKSLQKSPLQIRTFLSSLLKRNATLQEFVKSISQMHIKIENQSINSTDLRSIWKWLKVLGQEYNYFKKLKKPLARQLGVNTDCPIQQIIDRVLLHEFKIVI